MFGGLTDLHMPESHYPECNRSHPPEGYYYTADDCICPALRACEARATTTEFARVMTLADARVVDAFAAGVAAARALVADSPTAAPTDDYRLLIRREAALAAIDKVLDKPDSVA